MDEDDIQHLDVRLPVAVLTVGATLAAALLPVLLTVLVLATAGCVVQVRQEDAPELVRLEDTPRQRAATITLDGDSKDAPISIQAE